MARMLRRLALCVLAAATLTPPAALAEQDLGLRFRANAAGNIVLIGNTLLTCPSADPDCPPARQGIGTRLNNNSYTAERVDVDGDPATVTSSAATLSLPAGAS